MGNRKLLTVLKRLGIVLLVTVFVVLAAAYAMMFTIVKGPSPTARRLFVRSVREASAIYWLADLFCTEEEIAAIEADTGEEILEETDTDLVVIAANEEHDFPQTDEWGLTDEDGDGLIFVDVTGVGYVGKLMVVLDPSRVVFGTPPTFENGGMTVEKMCQQYDCIAGINGGGFQDTNGTGNGGTPEGLTICGGEIRYDGTNALSSFVGFDENHILHTGRMTGKEALAKGKEYKCENLQ